MNRHLAVMSFAFAACGSKQPSPKQSPDAVAVAPDAEPAPPPPPEVPPQTKSTDVDELRGAIKAAPDKRAQLILYGHLAEALWDQSCEGAIDNRLCTKSTTRGAKALPTCDGHEKDVKAAPRKAKLTKTMWEAIATMRQLWGGGSALHEITDPAAQADEYVQNHYLAEELGYALLMVGDGELELLFRIAAPDKLDFRGKAAKASKKKLDAWLQAMDKQADEAEGRYLAMVEEASLATWAPWAVTAAMARIGETSARKARVLRGFEIPKALAKNADATAALCDTMNAEAQLHEAKALEAYRACVARGDELGVTGGWRDQCAGELSRLEALAQPAP